MKVFVINVVCGVGSTGRIVADIYQLLRENGDLCRVAYSRGTAAEEIDSLKIGSKMDVYEHALFSRITDKQGFFSKKATEQLISEIKAYNPDIIHLHNLHGYYLNVESLFGFLKQYSKPIIWTLHDCWSITGHCAYFSSVQCEKWITGCYDCTQKKVYPTSWLADNSRENWSVKKQIFNGLDLTIVTVSKWLNSVVAKSFLKEYEIKTIYNGVDLNVFTPTESTFRADYGIKDKYIILGVASVWSERKGINDFLRLAEMLDDNYLIVLVGVTKKQKKELKHNMIGIENIDDTQCLVELYSTADVFVNTSVEETFGMTTVEALACGTPAIAYNATGIPEVLADMPEMIVGPHDIIQVKKIIENICQTGIEKEKLLTIARKFDKQKRFQEYLDLYKEVVQ